MIKPTRIDAIAELSPLTRFSSDNNGDVIEWDMGSPKSGLKQPTDAEIDSKLASMTTAWESQNYARKRQAEYPTIQECVHAILDDDLVALQEKRQAVKTKYPKS